MTGLVSPQFHVAFDPSFRTAKEDLFDSHWQLKAGFLTKEQRKKATARRKSSSETIYKRSLPEQEGAQIEPKAKRVRFESESTLPEETNVEARSTLADPDALQQLTDDTQSVNKETSDNNEPPESQKEQQSSEPVMRVMETMISELSKVTAQDVSGEIFCY